MATTSCFACGATILVATAEATGGVCIPCKNGTRAAIEASKRQYKEEREWARTNPVWHLWLRLAAQVHASPAGFEALRPEEQVFYAVNLLRGSVYSGGFSYYFAEAGGALYARAERGLEYLSALNTLGIVRQAKTLLFGADHMPDDVGKRAAFLDPMDSWKQRALDDLDRRFWEDPEGLWDRLDAFARENVLRESA
jgi:hypothetical protein